MVAIHCDGPDLTGGLRLCGVMGVEGGACRLPAARISLSCFWSKSFWPSIGPHTGSSGWWAGPDDGPGSWSGWGTQSPVMAPCLYILGPMEVLLLGSETTPEPTALRQRQRSTTKSLGGIHMEMDAGCIVQQRQVWLWVLWDPEDLGPSAQ
jgi:hypothetical protein